MKSFTQKVIDYGLLVILFVFPISVNIGLISPDDPDHPLLAVNFSVADLLIGMLLFIWLLKVTWYKEWNRILLPSAPVIVFVFFTIISIINAHSLSDWAKESIQIIEYFLFFYLLLLNNLRGIKLDSILRLFLLSASGIILLSFLQYAILEAESYLVRGFFENRNFMGAFLCLVVPIAYSVLLNSPVRLIKIWMLILVVLSVFILVSGGATIAILMAIAIISWNYGLKIFKRFIVIASIIILCYPFVMPQRNVQAQKEFYSFYESGSISENYYRRLTMLGEYGRKTLLKKSIDDNYILVTTGELLTKELPLPSSGERYKEMDGEKHVKNRFIEMKASLNLISDNLLSGVGAGNFQNHIGSYYGKIPKVNTAEPGQHNGYLIIASTTGVFGLAAIMWMFFSLLKKDGKNRTKGIPLGLHGALIACVVENLFVYILSSAILVPLVFVIYLSQINKE